MSEHYLVAYKVEPDYYLLLGVKPEATQVEIEESYRQVSKHLSLNQQVGQDRIKAAESLFALTDAYSMLSDAMQRSWYDIRRFGREDLPLCERVQRLFSAGIKSYREHQIELALRYFKEAAHLYPHRSLFRVHLALTYAEKKWLTNAEHELKTALRLDPQDRFAKETIARLLFEYESFSREPRTPLLKRMGTGLMGLMGTRSLEKSAKTEKL